MKSMNQPSKALQSYTPHTSRPDNNSLNSNSRTTQSSNSTYNTKSLSILQFNIKSIRKQKAELECVPDQHKIDMATIQETKMEKAHKIQSVRQLHNT